MRVIERVELYKQIFDDSKAIDPVRACLQCLGGDPFDQLEGIRELARQLTDLYMVSMPVITVWVRDYNYVTATEEIFLTEPNVEEFLHQYRHHLQNIGRKYQRNDLLVEGKLQYRDIPYKDTIHKMYGEDDARAWAKAIIQMAQTGKDVD